MRKCLILIALLLLAITACSRGADELNFAPAVPAPASAPMAQADSFHFMGSYGGGAQAPVYARQVAMAVDRAETTSDNYFVEYESTIAEQQRVRHIIQTAWVELESEYFDDAVADLRQIVESAGGFIEAERTERRHRRVFTITLRVPAANFEYSLWRAEASATVRSTNQHAEDVTSQFYDTTSRLETRRIEEDRLLALIEDAENVHDILELERRLSNTRLQIETYAARLNNLAGQIAYSTIFVTLHDTGEIPMPAIEGPGLWERIGNAFGGSVTATGHGIQNFVIFMAGATIPFVFWGVIIFITVKIGLRLRRKFKRKKAATRVVPK